MPSLARSNPTPVPRGNRKHDGLHGRVLSDEWSQACRVQLHIATYWHATHRSSMAAQVATMLISSASFEGAMHTMLGRHAMYATSKAPQCVAPSAPTKPARSIAKRTAERGK